MNEVMEIIRIGHTSMNEYHCVPTDQCCHTKKFELVRICKRFNTGGLSTPMIQILISEFGG